MKYDAAANSRDGYDLAIREIREKRIQKSGLTKRQYECLEFIKSFIAGNGYSPNYDEIGEALGIKSRSSISRLVHGLQKRGHITMIYGQWRSIAVVERVELPEALVSAINRMTGRWDTPRGLYEARENLNKTMQELGYG